MEKKKFETPEIKLYKINVKAILMTSQTCEEEEGC